MIGSDQSDLSSNDGDWISMAGPLQRLTEAVECGEDSDVSTESFFDRGKAITPPIPSHPTQRKQNGSSTQRKKEAQPSTAGSCQQKRKKAANFVDALPTGDCCVVLEIFGGCMRWTGACIAAGLCAACPIELENGQWCNVEDKRVRDTILGWIEKRLVWFVHIATPCTRHSRARTQGKKQPAKATVVERFTAKVLRAIHQHRLLFCLENPYRSGLFEIPCIARALAALHAFPVIYDCCAWGACYMKRTELRTNVPQLNGLARACHDMPKHTHEHLQGSVTFLTEKGGQKSVWKTKLAGKYVPEWCHAYASILVAIAPEEARAHSGKVAWSSSWQAQLVAATGHVTTPSINVPTCPQHSICEWAHAVSTWTHSECARSFRVVPPGRGLRLPKAPSNRCRRRKAHRCYAKLDPLPALGDNLCCSSV